MTLICAILVLFYVINGLIYLFAIIYLLIKKSKKDNLQNNKYPFVSIIIPSRNESQNIIKCLKCLKNQSYPADKFEIIPVNDASEDGTERILNQIAENDPHIHPVHISVSKRKNQGKLNAIDMGIQCAKGNIIITTDADIRMEPNWLGHMVKGFDSNTGLIIGMTLDKFTSHPVHLFQALDGAGDEEQGNRGHPPPHPAGATRLPKAWGGWVRGGPNESAHRTVQLRQGNDEGREGDE